MRVPRPVLAALAVLLGSAVLPALAVGSTAAAPATPTVVDIRAAHHQGFDRVVFELDGPVPAGRQVRYVDRLIADGSGLPVRVAGRAVLQVRLEPAQAHDAGGQTSARRRAFALLNVMTVVRAGDFEGVTTYGIGLARRTAYDVSVLRNPSRVVVDVRAAFPTVQRAVWSSTPTGSSTTWSPTSCRAAGRCPRPPRRRG